MQSHSHDPDVRPSVHLSNAWIVTKRKKVLPRFVFILVFRHEEWLAEDDPLYLKFWAKLTSF